MLFRLVRFYNASVCLELVWNYVADEGIAE
jgi:hypothetical protein